jgi:hypothetical protein
MKPKTYVILTLLMLGKACLADGHQAGVNLPTIETVCMEPVIIENISIWVPAAKGGPFINRSCRAKENLASLSVLPASINHEKTEICPPQAARILAELTAPYHNKSLPLTIFNGWQWEYTYSLCQFESVSYDLARRGGCWENCWEAVLSLSYSSSRLQWLDVESWEKFSKGESLPSESTIEVKTFSSMRTRDGYPKERQL